MNATHTGAAMMTAASQTNVDTGQSCAPCERRGVIETATHDASRPDGSLMPVCAGCAEHVKALGGAALERGECVACGAAVGSRQAGELCDACSEDWRAAAKA